jgi:ABC-type polysaccharide/polyol phosphate transport system ATPase subunit
VDVDVYNEEQRLVTDNSYQPAVSAFQLRKKFKKFVAVRNVSLGMNYNECFGLLGKSRVNFHVSRAKH